MGMKDKGGRAVSSGNEFMSLPHDPKRKVAGTKICKDRAKTRRASRAVIIKFAAGESVEPIVHNPLAKANFLMGW